MYNRVILIGNLTRDVELRHTPNGTALAKIGLATNRTYKDNMSGENKQEVMFIDVDVWGRPAETANQYLKKGSKVLVEGRLTFQQWTDQNGQKRSKHAISAEKLQFLDSRNDQNNNSYNSGDNGYNNYNNQNQGYNNNQPSYNQPTNSQPAYSNNNNNMPEIDIDNEDIPF
jgi:single-strand DNA-binding protein